jgi:hypothetical protein
MLICCQVPCKEIRHRTSADAQLPRACNPVGPYALTQNPSFIEWRAGPPASTTTRASPGGALGLRRRGRRPSARALGRSSGARPPRVSSSRSSAVSHPSGARGTQESLSAVHDSRFCSSRVTQPCREGRGGRGAQAQRASSAPDGDGYGVAAALAAAGAAAVSCPCGCVRGGRSRVRSRPRAPACAAARRRSGGP